MIHEYFPILDTMIHDDPQYEDDILDAGAGAVFVNRYQ